ncbi:MAG: NADH:ubiquinone oxidoreductase [Nitrospirota bacterium]
MDSQQRSMLTYLGVPIERPNVAFFELTSCEGCQLQIVNNEATLFNFLSLVNIVNFREVMTEKTDAFDIAFVEGSVTRADEVERLNLVRKTAKVLVAFGSCACFGGVNQLKNRFPDPSWPRKQVYGNKAIATNDEAKSIDAFVRVDLRIYGCPVKKEEVERIVTNIVIGKAVVHPKYPVCMECKANENICLFDLGEPCLGPVTRGGCDSWCPNNRAGCWGCRGPCDDANVEQMKEIMRKNGFSEETLLDRLECFGGFAEHVTDIRRDLTANK